VIQIARILSVFFFFTLPLSSQQKSLLNGEITDELGAAVSRARVIVHWDSSGSQAGLKSNVGISEDLILQTDEAGKFSTELPTGFYDLFVSSAAFTPACQKIRLKQQAALSVKFKLKANPLVTKELGHQIYAN